MHLITEHADRNAIAYAAVTGRPVVDAIEQISEGFQAKIKTHHKTSGGSILSKLPLVNLPNGEKGERNVRFPPPAPAPALARPPPPPPRPYVRPSARRAPSHRRGRRVRDSRVLTAVVACADKLFADNAAHSPPEHQAPGPSLSPHPRSQSKGRLPPRSSRSSLKM
jgi:hypothetical protein